MWAVFLLGLLVGATASEEQYVWEPNQRYVYNVSGQNLAALHQVGNQYSGITTNMTLFIQLKDKEQNAVRVEIKNPIFSRVHANLSGGWDNPIPAEILHWRPLPLSKKFFDIVYKNGRISYINVPVGLSLWETNILRSIASVFQFKILEDIESVFKDRLEPSVTGKCDVKYTSTLKPKFLLQPRPDLALPEFVNDTQNLLLDVVKEINYTQCERIPRYSFGLNEKPISSRMGDSLAHSTVGRAILLNDTGSYTIASARVSEKFIVSPFFAKPQKSMLGARMVALLTNITRVVSKISAGSMERKGLVYEFHKQFEGGSEWGPQSREQSEEGSSSESESESDERRHRRSADDSESWFLPSPSKSYPPSYPFDPFFVAFGGGPIQNSSTDPIKLAVSWANAIGNALAEPTTIPQTNALGHFHALANLLQTFNSSSLEETAREIYGKISQGSKAELAWEAYTAAVAQAGTWPALDNVEWMVKKGMLRGKQAAQVIAAIPMAARAPTALYVRQFFNFVTNKPVTSSAPLRRAGIIAFARLSHMSQVNNKTQNARYPVTAYGELSTTRDNKDVEDTYLYYLRQKLNQAIADANSTEIQLYIVALGELGHPRILETFEPYLEGRRDISGFQRFLIVMSLGRLVEAYPKVAQKILVQLYQNVGESHEVRCISLLYLMVTNPNAALLQQIATFTNADPNRQVRSAAKSILQSVADLTLEADAELARAAQSAVNLLTPIEFGMHFTKGHAQDSEVEDLTLAYRQYVKLIGSMDSSIHSAISWKVEKYHDKILRKDSEARSMVSSVQQFVRVLTNGSSSDAGRPSSGSPYGGPQPIPNSLNIQRNLTEQLEGNLLFNNLASQSFYPFDNHTVDDLMKYAKELLSEMKRGVRYNKTVLTIASTVNLGFPSVLGLPAFIFYTEPTLLQVRAHTKTSRLGSEGSIWGALRDFNVTVKLDAVYSTQLESIIGFSTPFDAKVHQAQLVKKVQEYLPVQVTTSFDKKRNNTVTRIQPIDKNKEYQVFHWSQVPATAVLPAARSRGEEGDVQIVHVRKPVQWQHVYGRYTTGMAFRVNYKSEARFDDKKAAEENANRFDMFARLYFPFYKAETYFCNVSIFYDPKQSVAKDVTINTTYEQIVWEDKSGRGGYNEEESSEESESDEYSDESESDRPVHPKAHGMLRKYESQDGWRFFKSLGNQAFLAESKQLAKYPHSRQQLRESVKANKDVVGNGTSYVMQTHITFERPHGGQFNATFLYTAGRASNLTSAAVSTSCRLASSKRVHTTSALLAAYVPQLPIFDLNKVRDANPNSTIWLLLNSNAQDDSSERTWVFGKLEAAQSKRLEKSFDSNPVFKECERQMQLGDYILPSCRNATEQAGLLDYYHLTLEYGNVPNRVMNLSYQAYSYIRHQLYPFLNETVDMRAGHPSTSGQLKSRVWFSPQWNALNASLVAEGVKANFTNVRGWNPQAVMPLIPHPSHSVVIKAAKTLQRNQYYPYCSLDKNNITTIDNVTYPVELGGCWSVVLTTVVQPYWNDDFEYANATVLAYDNDDEPNSRAIRILTGKYRIDLNSTREIIVNKKRYPLSVNTVTDVYDGKFHVAEAKRLPGGSAVVTSPHYGLTVHFDGLRVLINTNDTFRDNVRGLCGTNNGEHVEQFTSPRNCVLRNHTLFAASYVLRTSECRDRRLTWLQDEAIKTRECYPVEVLIGDYVDSSRGVSGQAWEGTSDESSSSESSSSSSDESGPASSIDVRSLKIMNLVRAKIHENLFCFSMVKVPTCIESFIPSIKEPKKLPYHCVKRSPLSEKWYNTLKLMKGGVSHDFSKKKVTVYLKTFIHKECRQ